MQRRHDPLDGVHVRNLAFGIGDRNQPDMDGGAGADHAAGIDPVDILEYRVVAVESARQAADLHEVFLNHAEIHFHVVHALGDFPIELDGFRIHRHAEFVVKLAGYLLVMIDSLPAASIFGVSQHQQAVDLLLKRAVDDRCFADVDRVGVPLGHKQPFGEIAHAMVVLAGVIGAFGNYPGQFGQGGQKIPAVLLKRFIRIFQPHLQVLGFFGVVPIPLEYFGIDLAGDFRVPEIAVVIVTDEFHIRPRQGPQSGPCPVNEVFEDMERVVVLLVRPEILHHAVGRYLLAAVGEKVFDECPHLFAAADIPSQNPVPVLDGKIAEHTDLKGCSQSVDGNHTFFPFGR